MADRRRAGEAPLRLPLVLTRAEVQALLAQVAGVPWIMASLLYGSELRLMECARSRVKDVDLARAEIIVRDGKGRKDRVTMIPERVCEPLATHLARVRRLHQADLAVGAGHVALPDALARKYPNAAREWGWSPAT